jgi:hypothetical protein
LVPTHIENSILVQNFIFLLLFLIPSLRGEKKWLDSSGREKVLVDTDFCHEK